MKQIVGIALRRPYTFVVIYFLVLFGGMTIGSTCRPMSSRTS